MALLPDNSVDVTITSPPYGAMKDYGAHGQIGFGQSYEEYLKSLSVIFKALFAKTKDTGSLWLVADSFRENSTLRLFPFDVANLLGEIGWHLQDVVVWSKSKTLPWSSPGRFRRIFEYVLFFSRKKTFKYFISRIKEPDNLKEWWVKYPERYSPEGKVPTTIWSFPIPVQGSWSRNGFRHFCPFPPELIERILLLTTESGDCVVDPFAGSGVVLAQAKAMGRKFIGCDVNRAYVKQFHRVTTNHVGAQWRSSRQILAKAAKKQLLLADTIRRLRQVKFPKALFKEVRRVVGSAEVRGIRAIIAVASLLRDSPSRHQFSRVVVYLLCEQGAPTSLIEREACRISRKPPLSKYGIQPEVRAFLWDEFVSLKGWTCIKGGRLYLYSEGNTNFYHHKVRPANWFSKQQCESWNRIPPILTNVDVRQVVIRTWQQRKLGT